MTYPRWSPGGMRNINMETLYRPQVVNFMPNGDENGVSGLGGLLSSMFDKPDSWYKNVDRIQKELAYVQAGVSAIGPEVWNAVATRTGKMTSYDDTMGDLLKWTKTMLVTKEEGWLFTDIKGHIPTEAEIAEADARAKMYRGMLEMAKQVAPELKAAAERDEAQARAMIGNTTLSSPGAVGEAEFYRQVEERAKNLGTGLGLGLGTIAAVGVGLFLLTQRGGGGERRYQRNPHYRDRRGRFRGRRRYARRGKRGGASPLPWLVAAGLAYYILGKPASAETPTVMVRPPVASVDTRYIYDAAYAAAKSQGRSDEEAVTLAQMAAQRAGV